MTGGRSIQQPSYAAIARVLAALGEAGFFVALLEWLDALARCTQPLVLHFAPGEVPCVLYARMDPDAHERHVDRYLRQGAYLLDPFFRLSVEANPCGLFRLEDVAPDRFRSSEFYRGYYKQTGIVDELSLLLPLAERDFVHVSLCRCDDEKRFAPRERAGLEAAVPLVRELLSRHVAALRPGPARQGGPALHRQLQQVLEHFGSSLLTPREREVLRLVLQGHSNQAVAARLDISEATVKLHRKNAYEKLDIRSQAELFHLFIDSLASYDAARDPDPLAHYLRPPGS